MLRNLYTIGYEGLTLKAFIQILNSHGVERIIDVRRIPISRKQGFSKTVLSESLSLSGIDYVHIVELGTPQDVRQELRTTEDYEGFFEKVEKYMSSQKLVLNRALALAIERPSALMCFERNPEECHRIVVAVQLVKMSNACLTVEHIWL